MEGKEIILLGDTNCDFTKTDSDQLIDSNARHMANIFGWFNLVQLVEELIRATLDTAIIIHHSSTPCTRNIIKVRVHVVSLSDHYMVYFIRELMVQKRDHEKIKTRSMKHFSENKFPFNFSGIC